MNQDDFNKLQSITDESITSSIDKLFFFHQNIELIKTNQSKLIQILNITVNILQEAKKYNIYIAPEKLKTIRELSEELMFSIQSEEEMANICHDPHINNAILH